MRIITVSREFGSGGREIGKRIADILGTDYYDSEIISAVARNKNLDEHYVENILNNHGWNDFALNFCSTISSAHCMHTDRIDLLVEQTNVIERIAELGEDFVIVGRNADIILEKYHPFNIFVCADTKAKLERCRSRAPAGEDLSDKELLKKMKEIDKSRLRSRELISGTSWGSHDSYHMIVNTSDWDIRELAPAVAEFANKWFMRGK